VGAVTMLHKGLGSVLSWLAGWRDWLLFHPYTPGKGIRVATVAVLVICSLSLATVISARWIWGGIDGLAQAGDFFNIANAVFTGLALVGLVCTAVMQREELEAQRQDSKESGKAMQRQSREQFLSARLNATAALLKANETILDLDLDPMGSSKHMTRHQVPRIRQQIAVLLCEAELGFDGGNWTPAVEGKAINRYLSALFSGAARNCRRYPENLFSWGSTKGLLMESELRMLLDQYGHRHPALESFLENRLKELEPVEAKGRPPEEFAAWAEQMVSLVDHPDGLYGL